ncbi:protein FATTY ACID EXPORT 3, chloroplastic-like isoform X2 [Papaver somniferum]|uniref:protein FATTY ACID EXPORT 3, chloroplastic-like isoform X2 n=1 Tax=Papaver somniferum TaxID=3469 RepID=UPI000E6FE7CE|nr:protein FATTY ACID EXPORT 3, chloroplastic-like isoform X2 [Papaver somniferum]
MMTATVQRSFISHPNPNSKLSAYSFRIQSQAHNIPRRKSISVPPPKGFGRIGAVTPFLSLDHHHQHRGSKNNNIVVSFSASNQEEKKPDEIDAEKEKNEVKDGSEESGEASEHKHVEIDEEKEKSGVEVGAEESEEAWKHMLESFKEQALKMQDISQEAYELYSKRAAVILKETSEKLKIHAEKSSLDLGRLAKDISVEGKEYLSTVAEKSPEQVKDIVETFATSKADDWKNFDKVPHYFLGIPYGIRFGTILGGALLALSISSLRSWKKGQSYTLALKGQAVIAAILFLRPLRMFFQGPSFPGFITTIISGYMVAFFIYKIVLDGKQKKGPA